MWAKDSTAFIVAAKPPIGSSWERRNAEEHLTEGFDVDMFWVDIGSGQISEVYHHLPDDHKGPLAWLDNGDVEIQTSTNTVGRFHHQGDSWKQLSSITIPITPYYRFSFAGLTTTDGIRLLGTYETPTIAPDIFLYNSGTKNLTYVTQFNPQLANLQMASVESVQWTTSSGYKVDGFLFKPPSYRSDRRYPLVIQTKAAQGWFMCDSGSRPEPSFQPQPLADAGIMYLVRTTGADFKQADDIAQYPKGYPGHLGEAAFQMEVWEGAVESLEERGLIDASRVGIIGFSRTAWIVEFILTHSKLRFAAATATDGVRYSLGEYWMKANLRQMDQMDAMYGGPPYGETLQHWLDYSISFNLDKIHTPLLEEIMGYGVEDNIPGMVPTTLAWEMEISNGLLRLGKPAEFYFYPSSVHRMNVGPGHLENLERNYDWYRFWLQNYQDPAPSKRDQYANWIHLKEMATKDIHDTSSPQITGR
jgi:hypothetical protein